MHGWESAVSGNMGAFNPSQQRILGLPLANFIVKTTVEKALKLFKSVEIAVTY